MKLQLLQPQEIEVFYILPAIRSKMALALKDEGMKQKEIAKKLCLQESTVSQYIHSKRGTIAKFGSEVEEQIKRSAELIKSKVDLIAETQKVLALVKKDKKTICALHRELADVPNSCDVCFTRSEVLSEIKV